MKDYKAAMAALPEIPTVPHWKYTTPEGLSKTTLAEAEKFDQELSCIAELRRTAINARRALRKEAHESVLQMLLDLGTSRNEIYKKDGTVYSEYAKILRRVVPASYIENQRLPCVPPYLHIGDEKIRVNASSFAEYFAQCNAISKSRLEKAMRKTALIAEAVEYAKAHDVDVSHAQSPEDILDTVERSAQNEYRKSMQGADIDVEHYMGGTCSWTVGENRCDCGNNRYYLEIEGNFSAGYYSWGVTC